MDADDKMEPASGEPSSPQESDKTVVKVWISFTSISDIDVIKQQFTAEFIMTATWLDQKLEGKKNEDIDWSKEWNPNITFPNGANIENIEKSQRLFTMEQDGKNVTQVQELYRVRRTFRATMGLSNFPLDSQELSIVLSSDWSDKNIVFEKDMFKDDNIATDAGASSPEWLLCKHVHTDVDSQVTKLPGPPSDAAQPLYVIRCHVIRKPWHYFWNIALLMFFITGLSFASFMYIAYQLIVALVILLTGVVFKFAVTRNLPSVHYSTLLDKYFCIHLMFICLVALLSIGTTALGTPLYNLACTLGTLGIFAIIQLVCGIVSFLKLRASHQVETKYSNIYQKRADEIERMRRERDWYAERSKMPKTPTILLTPATARQFLFPSNGGTPKSKSKSRASPGKVIDPTKSYV